MRLYKLIILLIVTLSYQVSGQIVFKVTQFYPNQTIYRTEFDTIYTNKVTDLDFYRANFFTPYYYPKPFINKQFKDTTVVLWNNLKEKKEYKRNWTFSCTYDSLSRVIIYEYSGCFVCSQLPFRLYIYYDSLNRPIRFEERTNLNTLLKQNGKSKGQDEPYKEYIIRYGNKGDITQLKQLTFGKLDEQIDKL